MWSPLQDFRRVLSGTSSWGRVLLRRNRVRAFICSRADIVPRRVILEVYVAERGHAGDMSLCASAQVYVAERGHAGDMSLCASSLHSE